MALLSANVQVEIRRFTVEDVAAHNLGEDAATVRWLNEGHESTWASTRDWIMRGLRVHDGLEAGEYAFAVEVDGQLAGMVAVNPDSSLEGMAVGDVNVSFAVHAAFRGRGVAGAAVECVGEFVRATGLGSALVIRVEPTNTASVRVAEKTGGFDFTGRVKARDGADLMVYRRHLNTSTG